jgi:signal transduction histidine kinase
MSSQVPPGIDIVRDVPADMILNLDSQRLQEVFINLLMNAIQAIESPPGQIRISAIPYQKTHQAIITVEDTGAGIPENHFTQIFDPFFTTKPVGTGTGMGLSVVYGIIQKHQGTISVESKVGEGTRFSIRLPLQQSA